MMTFAILLAATILPQRQTETFAFVETIGSDTIAVELFRRTGEFTASGGVNAFVAGTRVVRAPYTRVWKYHISWDYGGNLSSARIDHIIPPEHPARAQRFYAEADRRRDSIHVTLARSRDTTVSSFPHDPALLFRPGTEPLALGVLDLMTRRAFTTTEQSDIPTLVVGARRPLTQSLRWVSGSPAMFTYQGRGERMAGYAVDNMLVRVDNDGSVTRRSSIGGVVRLEATKVDPSDINIDSLAADYAARDAIGEGFSPIVPAAHFTATIRCPAGGFDRSRFEMDYRRPAARGRSPWEELVPADSAWAPGDRMNFSIPHGDLSIGFVPFFTSLRAASNRSFDARMSVQDSAATLLVYQPGSDQPFRQIALTPYALNNFVERFTISVVDIRDGQALMFSWGNKAYWTGILDQSYVDREQGRSMCTTP